MNAIIFRDLLLSMLLGMVALVLLANFDPKEAEDAISPPGNLIVSITWPEGGSDVDLWLMGPGEQKPIGYSNKDGAVWNLLRDDTGLADVSEIGINYENAFSRGLPDGEYIVNIHGYRIQTPLPVQFELAINQPGSHTKVVFSESFKLEKYGEEITLIRFKIVDGKIDPNSFHQVYQSLRSQNK